MKRQIGWMLVLVVLASCLCGCSAVRRMLDSLIQKDGTQQDDASEPAGEETDSSQLPEIYCTYFHYFRTDDYGQWWLPGKDPTQIIGPEEWRRNIWIGNPADYPYIGIYDNVHDPEIMRWHIRLAKAAGISGFFLFINDWEQEEEQTTRLLDVAAEENFKIGFLEQHSYLGAAPRSLLDGRKQPLLPRTYIGYHQILEAYSEEFGVPLPEKQTRYLRPTPRSLRDVPADALARAIERVSGMVQRWKSHPAYLKVDGKPLVIIPYVDMELTAAQFKEMVTQIETNVGQDLYVVAIVPHVYMYFKPELVFHSKISSAWAETGADCFTNWTPNGMVTTTQSTRLKVMRFNMRDSAKWDKDPMIPIMPGFYDDGWRPGDFPAPTAPRNNGRAWSEQIEAALKVQPRFIFIQAWNEWHEGAQIEPSTNYSDPYLYLRILAQKLGRPWQPPPLPPRESVDPLRLPYLPY